MIHCGDYRRGILTSHPRGDCKTSFTPRDLPQSMRLISSGWSVYDSNAEYLEDENLLLGRIEVPDLPRYSPHERKLY